MIPTQIDELIQITQGFYPTFRVLETHRQLWHTDLAPYAPALALECLKEWVRWHPDFAPSLGECVARCRAETAKRAKEARTDAPRRALPDERSPDQATFGQLMTTLLARTVWPWEDARGQTHPALTLAECATQCDEWSDANVHRPQLARELRDVAAHYRRMAQDAEEAA